MPINYLTIRDLDDPWEYEGGEPGHGYDFSIPPAPDTIDLLTKRWIDVKWEYTEPTPGDICTGFEVAIFHGNDIDTGILAIPIEFVAQEKSTEPVRRYITHLEMRTRVDLKAAVRACYGGFRSQWIYSPVARFDPENANSSAAQNLIKFPDGTIMQWMTPDHNISDQGEKVYRWPTPFPNRCYCVSVTTGQLEYNVSNNANIWFQLIKFTKENVTVYKKAASGANMTTSRVGAHIVGWGR